MKDIKTEREQLSQIVDSLVSYDVLSACQHMQSLVSSANDEDLLLSLQELEEDYRAILLLASTDGISTPERSQRIDELKQRGFLLHSRLSRSLMLTHEKTVYTSTYLQLQPKDWKKLWRETIDMDERTQLQDEIFDYIWTSPLWSEADRLWWQEFMEHQNELVLQHWLGALIQSLWMFWDVEKMYLLAHFAHSNHENVRALSVLGNIVVVNTYSDYYSSTFLTPNSYIDLSSNHDEVLTFQYEFMRMKACELMEEAETKDMDFDIPGESSEQKMKRMLAIAQRFNRLRIKHELDHSFSKRHLLHISAFLKRTAHWWAPFDESRSEVAKACYDTNGDVRQEYQLLIEGSHECDLQHYLSCFMLSGNNIRMEISGEMPEDFLERMDRTPLPLHKRLVHNLYRINYQSPCHQFQKDLFKNVSFVDNSYLRPVFTDKDVCQVQKFAADLELKGQLNIQLLEDVVARLGLSADLAQVLAHCYILEKQDFAKALSYLEQADLLCEADSLLLRNMVFCAHRLEKFDREITLLKRLRQLDANDMMAIQNLANLYYQLKRYEEAIPVLQEFTYRYPDYMGGWMQLLFSSIQLNRMDDTQKSFARMFQRFPTHPLTFFMAGSLALMKDDWNAAIAHFRRMSDKEFDAHFLMLDDLPISQMDKELIYDCVMRQ